MDICWYIVVVLFSYLIGSLSFGAMIAKIHGVNIFKVGSTSSGATNVRRTVGTYAGYCVFLLDFLKGFLPSWGIINFSQFNDVLTMRLAALSLVGVLIGHVAPIFYKFKGGKGIAATMGGLLAIMPNTLIIGILVWLVIYHATKIVSVASMCFIASTLLTSYLFSYPKECMVLAILLNIIIFWRHRENIVRLANGTEYKFTKRG